MHLFFSFLLKYNFSISLCVCVCTCICGGQRSTFSVVPILHLIFEMSSLIAYGVSDLDLARLAVSQPRDPQP